MRIFWIALAILAMVAFIRLGLWGVSVFIGLMLLAWVCGLFNVIASTPYDDRR